MTAPVNNEFVSGTTITSNWLNGVNDHVNNIESDPHPAYVKETTLASDVGASMVGYDLNTSGSILRTVSDKLGDVVSVKDFGAVGDGVTDDGVALSAALIAFKSKIAAVSDSTGCIVLDLAGGVYKTTVSLNATGIASWGWSIENGTILGHCVNKAVLDLTGSRGGKLSNIVVHGDINNKPRVGIQAARASGSGADAFCDNMLFENVATAGYYTLASVFFYGQETTTHINCQYWTYDKDAYAAIHTGYDWEPYQSDYKTSVTGDTSYINDKYINCDWRYLPVENIATITAITNANPAVVTAMGHPFTNGDSIVITQVAGMTNINNVKATIANATEDTFELVGVNSSSYGVYISGGVAVISQTKPTVLFGRAEQHSFDTCYIVNYGTDSIEWRFPVSVAEWEQISFDFLFEGAGSRSHVRLTTGGAVSPNIRDFKFRTYNTHSRDYIFSTDSGVGTTISIYAGELSVSSHAYNSPKLFDTELEYALYDVDVVYPDRVNFAPASTSKYIGNYTSIGDGDCVAWNVRTNSDSDGVWTPVVAASTGVLTSYTATGTSHRVGDLVHITVDINITNNGTGSNSIIVSGLPCAASVIQIIGGRENNTSGAMLSGVIAANATSISVRAYSNAYPAGTGSRLLLSGVYHTNDPI